ncbi:bZIP transcription factor 1 [Phytophthora cinnamomi]|uniref:bZIP transcription factor 1 n=1 Tax=Phytophthora cinnamomi TaxID=4785 RepID=UPI00355A3304|nr:bZIP transcription factor 1 [Phytophthora cinnamomi]
MQRNRLFHGGQQNVWNVVVEYFHVFGFGVPVTLSVESIDSADMTVDCLENAEVKHQLVPAVEDVVLGERSGVDALMDQWCRYSSSFQGLYFQLERIERVGDHFVCVTAVMNVTVTKATLTNVFPHLQDDGKEQGGRGRNDCVSRLETTTNFLVPLTKVLGDLLDVALVLARSVITRDGDVGICALTC